MSTILSQIEFISLEQLESIAATLDEVSEDKAPNDSPRPDIAQCAALLRHQAQRIELHLRSEALIAAISSRLLNVPLESLEAGLHEALSELGKSAQVQRAYVFLLSEDSQFLVDAYEWVAEGTEGHDFESFKGVSVDAFPWSMDQFRRGENVIVSDPQALPKEADPERGACDMLSIRSYVNMPLFLDSRVLGWLGFDAVGVDKTWSPVELKLMEIARDVITSAIDRKRREELVFRQRELTQRVTSMGVLAAGLAHEINNPLSFVIGNLSYLEEVIRPSEVANPQTLTDMRESLEHAREGAGRVYRIVDDLRALSRGEATELCDVDLQGVINATLRMASNQLRHRARVVRNYAGAPKAMANPSQLGQVLLNVVLNAAQAIPEGKAPDNEVELRVSSDADRVHIHIRDTGSGIPADVLPRIFDPFYTRRDVGEGMGMGLAICHSIVASFGGSITAESEMGVGTTIKISLPRAGGETTATDARERPCILLVDDEPRILDMLARFLRGNELVFADNGRAALQKIDESPDLDLILCDVMMPDVCGPDVYQYAKERYPGLESRIVFVTGGALSGEIDTFLKSVSNPIIHKPFEPKLLREIVAGVLTAAA